MKTQTREFRLQWEMLKKKKKILRADTILYISSGVYRNIYIYIACELATKHETDTRSISYTVYTPIHV